MKPDDPMSMVHEDVTRETHRSTINGPRTRTPITSIVALVAFLGSLLTESWLLAMVFAMAFLGFITAWVYGRFMDLSRAGLPVPRWLAFLERLREDLASEPPPVAR